MLVFAPALLFTASVADEPLLAAAVYEAIQDEIQRGLEATKNQDIELYMQGVPEDTRIVEEDGSITDAERLRSIKLQEWAIIPRTNAISMTITGFRLDCAGACASVWTDQEWDRQMIGRDGVTEFNVVTTQKHRERWELRNSRWTNVETVELGGTTMVDGKPY